MILVETSLIELYEGQPLMPEMLTRLTAAGHTLWSLIPGWIDRVNGRLWWGDGLFVVFEDAGHFPHIDWPERFNAAAIEFLSR